MVTIRSKAHRRPDEGTDGGRASVLGNVSPHSKQDLLENLLDVKINRKSQYERQFQKWGWRRNLSREEWILIGQEIEYRRQRGKRSLVYVDGEEIDSKRVKKGVGQHATISDIMKVNWQGNHLNNICNI